MKKIAIYGKGGINNNYYFEIDKLMEEADEIHDFLIAYNNEAHYMWVRFGLIIRL